ncbi:MAG: hypothetical protein KBD24_03540, partial [Candidatus Pacebacteria bacterium]|nr:hypothetical protein [Candidatus Paceibacterota bacterium]
MTESSRVLTKKLRGIGDKGYWGQGYWGQGVLGTVKGYWGHGVLGTVTIVGVLETVTIDLHKMCHNPVFPRRLAAGLHVPQGK